MRTGLLLDVVPRLRLRVRARNPRHLEHAHDPVQQPVDDLEPGGLVAPDRCGVADVARLPLARLVLEDDVRSLKDLDRERV